MSDFNATHLVAIGVGVGIAMLFIGSGSSKTVEETTSSKPKTSKSTTASAAPAAKKTTDAKKKTKKKSKKKAAPKPAAAATAAATVAPAPAPAPKVAPPAAAPAPAVAPAPPANVGKKKKNKKKNGATTTPGATPQTVTAAPTPATVAVQQQQQPASTSSSFASFYATPLQPRVVVEEEWETIPTKSKKKKNSSLKKQQQQASASASEAATKASVSVTIDASRIGIIIGPKGATMNAIQEKTGTKLDVNAPKLDENSSGGNQFRPVLGGRTKSSAKATVIITEGSPDAQKAAKQAILELADRGYATLLQAAQFGESSVGVHPRFLSEIVGPGGKIIKAIQSGLDVKLTIPKTDWSPKAMQIGNIAPSVRVGIAGDSPANVKLAKQVIKDLCDYHHHDITHPGFIHQEVYVPEEFFHCVIGTRGSEIKHIRGNYHVDVYIPSNEVWCVTENVICVGKPNDVEKAISYIKLLMDRDSELREQKYSDEGFGDDSLGW